MFGSPSETEEKEEEFELQKQMHTYLTKLTILNFDAYE
jgi:hypothetical protein